MIEALMGVRVSREGFNKGAVKVARGVAGLALISTIGCARPKEDTPLPTPSVVAPGIKFLDKEAQALAEKARELAGMDQTPTPAQLKAKEITPKPTIPAAPDYPATIVAKDAEITQLRAAAKAPEPAKPTAEAQKPVEKLQNIELKLVTDVPAGTAISPKSIQIARDMIEKRVAESQLEGSAKVDSQNRIIININGASNPSEAVETVSQTGLFEFIATGSRSLQSGQFVTTSEDTPRGTTAVDGNIYQTILQNRHFRDASISFDQNNRPRLQLLLTEEGTQIFSQYTQSHVGQWLGVTMDKRVLYSAVIRSPLIDRVVIEGNFTREEIQKFVAQIKYGPLPFPFKVIEATTSLQPRIVKAEAPKPATVEKSKSIEYQARAEVLNTWISLLSIPQEKHGFPNLFFNPQIVNWDFWQKIIPQILESNTHSTAVPLRVKWLSGKSDPQWAVDYKYTGEMEINNLKVQTSANTNLSDADKANGFQARGRGTVSYIVRYRANYYFLERVRSSLEERMQWLRTEEVNPYPDFSPWEEERFSMELTLQNGKWERNFETVSNRYDSYRSGIIFPSGVLIYDGISQSPSRCAPNNSPCRYVSLESLPGSKIPTTAPLAPTPTSARK